MLHDGDLFLHRDFCIVMSYSFCKLSRMFNKSDVAISIVCFMHQCFSAGWIYDVAPWHPRRERNVVVIVGECQKDLQHAFLVQ